MLSAHGKPRRFVGRAAELDRLEAALEAAGSERGCTVLVGGEAGIGKTRLASELADRAHHSGAIVLTGHCIDLMGTGLPYLAILEALRPLRDSPVCTDIPELSRLVPDFTGPGSRSDDQPLLDQGGPERQVRLFEEVRALLDRLAVAAPLVLVLEDLHWAEASTLDLLSFLAYGITGSRILIVATYRDDEARVGDPLPRLVTGLVRAGRAIEMRLGPLAHDELTAVLRDVAETSLPAGLTETIVERSGGSPFFAEELLSAATRGEGTLPQFLRDTLLHRVAPLGADGRVVLQVAAAAARRDVPYGLLAAVVPLAEHQLQEALRKVVEHRVLVADQAAGTFRFRHALFAEAVYATLIPGEREELHTRLARALGENRASAAELASHWTAAGRPIEAFTASMRAARDAEAVSGRTEALAHLESVLALWPVVPGAGERVGMSLSAVVTWAAELAYMTGDG
ncbi:MAG TPA: AAA family ATPase, partial [Nocardioides sp.]|nr:AAA family ATPase [Nocardioides sp.]